MSKFQEIIVAGLQPDSPVKYYTSGGSIKTHESSLCFSIRENEFNFLHDYIVSHNLKMGFELGSAFGVSTVALGLGFKQTGGHLISMDSYTEEKFGHYTYDATAKDVLKNSYGYKSSIFLRNEFQLNDIVEIVNGWSPIDTPRVLKDKKLDFVFIDAMHDDVSVISDVSAIIPYLADKYSIFFHDTHCFSAVVNNYLIKMLGKPYQVIPSCTLKKGEGYNLALLENL